MRVAVLIIVMLVACFGLAAQVLNDYRSVVSGNWDALTTWEYWNGSAWVPPSVRPTNSSNIITIRNGHTVIATTNVSIDQAVVVVGATLRVNSGTLTAFNGPLTPDVEVFGTLTLASTGAVTGSATTLWIHGNCDYERNGGNIPLAS
ncbi:MAG: hypothetical protein Q8M98_09845 [Candidatus Cloacimonadaceae bacterium]|nr:hypothetical protein [Candidatus Cloacimonadaceae bacterium]